MLCDTLPHGNNQHETELIKTLIPPGNKHNVHEHTPVRN